MIPIQYFSELFPANELPLVSCLCVTKNELNVLRRAINCFRAQSYPKKELIIVKQNEDPLVLQYIENIDDKNIFYTDASPLRDLTLGDLRNLSIEKCIGRYFCVWDDDDWYHSDRLWAQMFAAMNYNHPATALTNELIFDEGSERLFFSAIRLWENSLLCKRDVCTDGVKYPPVQRGEDAEFLRQLLVKSKVFPVVSSPLYVYVRHGNNTTYNFSDFLSVAQELSAEAAKLVKDILEEKHSPREASELLDTSLIREEINYFYVDKKTINLKETLREVMNINSLKINEKINRHRDRQKNG